MRVAVVVATRNRPRHVTELLRSLVAQQLTPVVVVVVQSSNPALTLRREDIQCPPLKLRVEHTSYASLPHQRNIGASIALKEDVDAICFLDDDVRPRADYLSRLADLLRRDTVGAVGGVAGSTGWVAGSLTARYSAFNRIFLLSGPADGRVLRSGINMPVDANNAGVHEAQWLFGCSMWRVDVLRRHAFNEQLPGQALFEDVDFSVRVGKQQMLLVDSDARLDHLVEMDGRPCLRQHYERLVRNRAVVMDCLAAGRIGWVAFWWSVLGQALLLLRHVHSSAEYRQRFMGLLEGVVATLRNETPR